MALTEIKTSGIADDAITTDKLANAINTERTANTAKPTLANDANNRVVTGDGSGGLNGEANLTFDGTKLGIGTSSPQRTLHLSSNNTVFALTDTAASTDEKTKYILTDAGILGIGQLNDAYDTATEHLRIDSSGNVIIGTSSWSYPKALNAQGSSGSILSLYNADTTTYAADTSAAIEFKLLTGNTGNQTGTCEIRAFKEEGTNGNNARGLSFWTAGNGGANSEKLRIQSGGGISFNGDSDAANALDDYEEGYWSPTAVDGMTLHIQNGNNVAARRYVKIGKVVTCWFDINYDSNNSSANFAARFSGLPFSKEATSEGAGGGVTISYFDGSETWINGHTDSANVFKFFKNGDSMYSYSNSAGDRIAGHFTYVTA